MWNHIINIHLYIIIGETEKNSNQNFKLEFKFYTIYPKLFILKQFYLILKSNMEPHHKYSHKTRFPNTGTHIFRAFLCFAEKQQVSCTVHGTRNYFFQQKKTLKLGLTILFIHLKIIFLQCFQFSIFSNKRYPKIPQKKKTGGQQNLLGFINHAGPFAIQQCHSTYGYDHVNKVRIPTREPRN